MEFISKVSGLQTLVSAIVGLIAGGIGSLIAPWVHWSFEKRREKLKYRRNLIKEWRKTVESFDWVNDDFGNSSTYAAMRTYIRIETIKSFEAQRTLHVPPDGGRGKLIFKQKISNCSY